MLVTRGTIFFHFSFVVWFYRNWTLCFALLNLFNLWNLHQRATAQKVTANISITFNQKSLTASSVIAALLFSSSVVVEKPGSPATWFRAGLQCTGVRELVGVWMYKSSFLLRPFLFFEPEQRVATAMRLVRLPLRGSGKSSSLPWHLHRLEETETMERRHTDIHTHQTKKRMFVCVCVRVLGKLTSGDSRKHWD